MRRLLSQPREEPLNRTRILMTAEPTGGVWTYAMQLIGALNAWGCDVTLATVSGMLQPEQCREAARLPNLTLCESASLLEWVENPKQLVEQAGVWLLELARRIQPDVVHLNHYAHGALSWPAPVLMVGHSCLMACQEAIRGNAAKLPAYRRCVREALAAADVVVAPTQTMLVSLVDRYGPLSATEVIGYGRERKEFAPTAKENLILAVGRLGDESKNIKTLDACAPHLTWPIYVAGEEPSTASAWKTVQHLHALGRLATADLADQYARATIFVLPARYEPFGLSVLEAALSGCALVLGDIASLREVWQDAALYVPPDDAGALTAALARLIAEPELRHSLATSARKRAEHFTSERMGAAYWNVYRRLLGKTSAKSDVSNLDEGIQSALRLLPCA